MAEALASLGTAAAIAQFVTIGLKGAAFIWKTYESADGLIEEYQDLLVISSDLQNCCTKLQAEPLEKIDGKLKQLLCSARELAVSLEKELKRLERTSSDSAFSKLLQSLRAMRGRSKIEDLERRLSKLRDQIELSLCSALV